MLLIPKGVCLRFSDVWHCLQKRFLCFYIQVVIIYLLPPPDTYVIYYIISSNQFLLISDYWELNLNTSTLHKHKYLIDIVFMFGFGIFCGFFMKTMRIILAILKTSSLNGLYGLQHCSSVTNDWKSLQWVIVGLRGQLTITKMPFSVMELLVAGELCVLLRNESTKWIPALQVWCAWKAMLLIWVSLFPNTFWKHK